MISNVFGMLFLRDDTSSTGRPIHPPRREIARSKVALSCGVSMDPSISGVVQIAENAIISLEVSSVKQRCHASNEILMAFRKVLYVPSGVATSPP